MGQSLDLYRRCAWCGSSQFINKSTLTVHVHMKRGTRPAIACPGGGLTLVEHMRHLILKQKAPLGLDQKQIEVLKATIEKLTPEQIAQLPELLNQLEKEG